MTRLRAAYAMVFALAGAAAACGPGNTPTDAGDAMVQPETGADTSTGDSQPPTDGGDGGSMLCNMVPIENLNTLGMRMGDTVRLTGNNRMAMASNTAGIQVPARLQTFCAYRSTRQRIFSYTAMAAGVLRITTTNPGTDRTFDTTLTVSNMPCRTNQAILGCNDDDPAFGGDERRVSSALITLDVTAGQTVYIALGGFVPLTGMGNPDGEQGAFELTVQELRPVPDGMACDTRRLANTCATSSTCVQDPYPSATGTCRANGSVAGSQCATGGMCSTGLTCDAESDFCVREGVADGMRCDPFNRCGMNSSCVTFQRGGTSGICRANGTVAGAQCRMGSTCDAGLTCQMGGTTSICLRTAAMNGPCNTWDTVCPMGQDCVNSNGNLGTSGTCVNVGSVASSDCAPGNTCTGMGLTCQSMAMVPFCARTVPTGMACGFGTVCADGGTCYLTDPNNRLRGICFAPGTRGGPCRPTGMACDAGSTCSNAAQPADGRCIVMAASGGMCDFINQCPTGETCVRNGGGTTFMGTCRPRGARGALCRATGAQCDAGLTCSTMQTNEGLCQAAATTTCDARSSTDRCPTGQVCRATGLDTGTCAMPTNETEPNDVVAMSLPVTATPAAVRGALAVADTDCFALDVPAMGRVFARVTSPAGVCPSADLELALYRLEGTDLRLLGFDENSGVNGICPRIDGNDPFMNFSWARDLSAGRYFVCLRNTAQGRPAVSAYALSLNASTM